MEYNNDLLRKIHQTEQDILDEIVRVCRENGLRYSLGYGTLLGAVRHNGFIPWDDDIDIMLPREDYVKLLKIWTTCANKEYLLQDETMFADYVNNFAKVRKDHTTFLQFEFERNSNYQTGIYVDIFPGDRVAPKGISQRIQYVAFAVNLLFNRGYTSGTKGGIGFIERALLTVVPKQYYRIVSDYAGKISRKWNNDNSRMLVFPCTIRDCKRYYPNDLFEHLESAEFNGKEYYVFRDRHTFLFTRYGDYMQLPPKEEQIWKHHPILVDFEHNYDELDVEE